MEKNRYYRSFIYSTHLQAEQKRLDETIFTLFLLCVNALDELLVIVCGAVLKKSLLAHK